MAELLVMIIMEKTKNNKNRNTYRKKTSWKEYTDQYKNHAEENDPCSPVFLYIIAHTFVKYIELRGR
jgi:hypothetical protein